MNKVITAVLTLLATILIACPAFANSLIYNIDLESSGMGTWESEEKNVRYVLELYKDGYMVGDRHFTYGKEFDFSPLMQQEGDYHFEIGIYNIDYTKLGMQQSTGIYIDKNNADDNKLKYKIRYDGEVPLGLGWNKTDGEWRYRSQDGVYIQNNYLYKNGSTFYFDRDGIMVRDCWVDANGKLMYFDLNGLYDGKKEDKEIK